MRRSDDDHDHNEIHDQGLQFDLQTLLNRRGALRLFGIGAAYSLDRVFDAPFTSGTRSPAPYLLAFVGTACAAACARLLAQLPLETAVLVPVIGATALAYPRLKRVPFLKTAVVAIVWTWCAIALPYGDGSWFGWRTLMHPVALPLVMLMAAGCLLCDLKDEAVDRAEGVASVPALLGATRTAQGALALAGVAAISALLEQRTGLAVSAGVLSLTTLWPRLLATETIGPLVVDMVLTLPGVLIVTRLV